MINKKPVLVSVLSNDLIEVTVPSKFIVREGFLEDSGSLPITLDTTEGSYMGVNYLLASDKEITEGKLLTLRVGVGDEPSETLEFRL